MPVRNDYTREESPPPPRCVMRMGNLLRVARLRLSVMATSNQRLGIAHVTVVPTNANRVEGALDGDGADVADTDDDADD